MGPPSIIQYFVDVLLVDILAYDHTFNRLRL